MNRPRFWPYSLRGALIVLAASGLTFWFHHIGLFDRWENDNLDRWLLTQQPRQSEDIVLVVIDEDDYRTMFGSASPLKTEGVLGIIRAIAAGKPKVVGVDLDTSQWATKDELKQVKQFKDEQIKGGITFPQVVWARDGWTENGQFQMAPVLGDDPQDICYGLPALRVDGDGIVRRFFPVYSPAGEAPGFSTAVKRLYQGGQNCNNTAAGSGGHSEENERLIDFLGSRDSFRRLTAGAIVRLSKIKEWQTHSDFNGKIALLGGAYRAARDRHATPVGMMDGVEILAHAIQTELPGQPTLTEANPAVYLAADIAFGLTLVVGLYRLSAVWRIMALLGSVPLAILASLLMFNTAGYFFSFVPVIAGVRIHQVIEQYFEGRELRQENQELRHKLALRNL